MSSHRIVIGQFGGLSALARSVARALRERGATVMSTDEYEAAAQAAAANRFGATVYIGFEARTDPTMTISYFAVPTFESAGGRSLGTLLSRAADGALTTKPRLLGMRLPVLRETRMPAVLLSVGPVRDVVDRTLELTKSLVDSLDAWATSSLDAPRPDLST